MKQLLKALFIIDLKKLFGSYKEEYVKKYVFKISSQLIENSLIYVQQQTQFLDFESQFQMVEAHSSNDKPIFYAKKREFGSRDLRGAANEYIVSSLFDNENLQKKAPSSRPGKRLV